MPSNDYEQMSEKERDKQPKIIQGVTSDRFATLLFQHGQERYFITFYRESKNKFYPVFELNNQLNNLKNLADIKQKETYDILSMDSI
jgi:hypothetical protein